MNPPATNLPLNSTGGRQQLKMNSSGKSSDGARKQAGSPADGQRKPPQKAWTQATNPITQRPSANGITNTKPAQSSSEMNAMNERMIYLLAAFVGNLAEIQLKNGERYTGVLSGTSLDPNEMRHVFKMVKRIPSSPVNGASSVSGDYIGQGDNHVMAFDVHDVADLYVPDIVLDGSQAKLQNGVSVGFRTDTDISGSSAIRERHLQRWEPSAEPDMNHSLESTGRSTEWDQFSTNERLFGVKSDYDENIYTTTIDRNTPQYAEKEARAMKIAREIESSSALNSHVREERGQAVADDKGGDEEDKYSGVRRDFPPLTAGGSNKYTPPARRPPTGQPTVSGAPVDPAIISSQLARPDSASAKPAVSPSEKLITPDQPKPEVGLRGGDLESAQTTAPKAENAAVPPSKTLGEQTEKPSSALKPGAGGVAAPKPAGRPVNQPASVESQLLESFRQFSNQEKMKVQERQRTVARETKSVRLNDLKKFSQNFKLNTPVPQDLVPILAKDKSKQQEIVQKALQAAQEKKSPTAQSVPSTEDVKTPSGPPAVKPVSAHQSPAAAVDRQQNQRPRPGPNHSGSAIMRGGHGPNQFNQGPKAPGMLSHRLQFNQHQYKAQGGLPMGHVPNPIPPIQDRGQDFRAPTGPSAPSSGVQSPASSMSSRFNVRANEFRPNPTVQPFQPGGTTSANASPRPDSATRQETPREPQKPKETSFFGGSRPTVVQLDLDTMFNPINRLTKEAREASTDTYRNNGGIPPPYRTPPTWDFPKNNTERNYISMFESNTIPPQVSAPHNVTSNGPMPHQHQLPPHLQGPPSQGPTPGHTPRHLPVQPHQGQGAGPHFEGHNMQFSHSTSSIHPSPRAMHPYAAYGAQPQAMNGFPQQPQMQTFGMSPGAPHAALRQQGGHQFMTQVPGMGGQMMTNQHSNGPFMGMQANPQMQMYSPAPGAAYPHYGNQMPVPPGQNGYPSPRPGAQMMHHQGSQQGHQQPQFVYMPQGGPMFASMPPGPPMRQQGYPQAHQQHYGSPQQHHQFPQAHRGTSSGSYSQPMMQQHSMPPQGPPPTGPANHGQESSEEAK